MFVDQLGHPYRPETLSRRFTALLTKAELRLIRLHDTRHTAASLMLAAGESPKVVADNPRSLLTYHHDERLSAPHTRHG